LAGYYGYDYLYGGDGDDRMWPEYDGGEMYGELGNDTYDFVMTSGANYYVYEYAIQGTDNSSDTLDFIGAAGPVNIDLASTNFQSMAGITLKLSDGMGIENVYCSENSFFNWSDTLSGNARPNILKGGVGDDWIYGYDGNDQLYGEDGNDHIYAGNGADTLWGGQGDDELYAFSDGSVDQVHGDAGSDTLHGIDGNDVLDSIELNLAT